MIRHLSDLKNRKSLSIRTAMVLASLCFLLPGYVQNPAFAKSTAEAGDGATEHFELTVLHVNDLHSRFDPGPMPELPGLSQALFGGYPAVLSYVNNVRSEQPNTLFVHGGDDFQGSGYFVLHHGRANADLLNRMGIDVMVAGNHEFDELREMDIEYAADGQTVESIVPGTRIPRGKPLADFLDLIEFPMLATNMRFDEDPFLSGKTNLLPWVVLSVDDKKVGFIGIVLEDMPSISSPGPDLEFLPEIESARRAVRELEALGVKKIIGLSHIGYMRDKHLVRSVDGIDIMVGGHSHDLLGDFSALGLPVAGPYPTVVTTPNGGQALVVQAGAYAKAVGRLDVAFDEAGRVVAWSGGNKLLAVEDTLAEEDVPDNAAGLIARVPEDEDLRAHIDRVYKPELERVYGNPIAHVPEPLRHERIPSDADGHGSQVAPLAAEALCWYMNERGIPVDVSIVNAGSVRSSIDTGDYYRNQTLMEVMIFANSVTTFPLTGAQLRTVLESVIMPGIRNPDFDGRFPYAGRLAYVFDPEKPQGERFVSLQILDADGTWEDLDDGQIYQVAASSYVAEGHDGYDRLREYIDVNSEERTHEEIIDNQTFTEYVMHVAEEHDGELRVLPYPTVTLKRVGAEDKASPARAY